MALGKVITRQAGAVALAAVLGMGETVVSSDGYADLVESEGVRLQPYYDVAGILTVCYGETEGIELRDYTLEECSEKLVNRVEGYFVPQVRRCTDKWEALPQEVKDVVVELAYNIGPRNYCRSSFRKQLDDDKGIKACARILPWNKARINGKLKPVEGLTNRRIREARKCEEGFQGLA